MELALLRRASPPDRPPGPLGLPVLGVIYELAADPLGYLEQLQRQHGDIVHTRFGRKDVYILTHPDDLEHVLLKDARSYWKDEVTRYLALTLGNGLLVSEGETWKRNRRLVAPALRKKQIDAYADAMVRAAVVGSDALAEGQIVDVLEFTMGITLQIVAETLFGADVQAQAHQVGVAIEAMMGEFVLFARSWRRLLPLWVPLPSRSSILRQFKLVDDIITGIIRQRRASGVLGDDLLSLLLTARDEDGSTLDDTQLRDEAVTIFVAGHETTSLNLTYTLRLLSEHPAVAERLQAEIDGVLEGRAARSADLARLPYTEAVIKESLRLYPPAWTVGREAIEDTKIGGWPVPRGTQVLLPIWVTHHDARWFPEPEVFRPERWLDGSTAQLPRFAYLPFGGGPRTCVGNHFALMEASLVLVTLLQRARFEALSARRPALVPAVTLRPRDGLRMRVHLRRSAS